MAGMFDTGLRAASTSGNYDQARQLAASQIEQFRSLDYACARDYFPNDCGSTRTTYSSSGSYTTAPMAVPASAGLPPGSTYQITKQYLTLDWNAFGSSPSQSFAGVGSDKGMLKVTVTVNWGGGSYTESGLVGDGE